MQSFSKTILPPILDYSYPSVRITGDDNGEFKFRYNLSVVNTPKQIDHIQIRIHSQETNSNGLNPNIFADGYYILDAKKGMPDGIKMEINNMSIFDIGGGAKASRYKIQMRIIGVNSKPYQASWGQNPPKGWMDSVARYTSEWSNTAIFKTVTQPNFGLFTLEQGNTDYTNILDLAIEVFSGWYRSNTSGEYLNRYKLKLYKIEINSYGEENKEDLIEESKDIYIGEYEYATINYQFKEVFEPKDRAHYKIVLETTSTSGYSESITYKVDFNLPHNKQYNVFEVEENDKQACNIVVINAKQVQLVATDEDSNEWLEDIEMGKYDEDGKSHYKINKGRVEVGRDASWDVNPSSSGDISALFDFTILLSIDNLQTKISLREEDAFGKNKVFEVNGTSGVKYTVGVLNEYGKVSIRLKENNIDGKICYYNGYTGEVKANQEFMIMIQKDNNETIFQVADWHTTDYEGGL